MKGVLRQQNGGAGRDTAAGRVRAPEASVDGEEEGNGVTEREIIAVPFGAAAGREGGAAAGRATRAVKFGLAAGDEGECFAGNGYAVWLVVDTMGLPPHGRVLKHGGDKWCSDEGGGTVDDSRRNIIYSKGKTKAWGSR